MNPIPILHWTKRFAIGHADLDAEHRHLVELINRIGFAIKVEPEQLPDLLEALHQLAAAHILHENAIMLEISSGTHEHCRMLMAPLMKKIVIRMFVRHAIEHDAMRDALNAIISGPVDQLCDGLKSWFIKHARSGDAELRALFHAAA